MQLALRILGMIVGLVASAIMLIVDVLYSLSHVLGRVAGFTADTTHFWWGLFITLVGLIGALLAPFSWSASVLLMLVATVAFYFIAGWWAIIPAIFFVVAMLLVYRDRGATTGVRTPSGV